MAASSFCQSTSHWAVTSAVWAVATSDEFDVPDGRARNFQAGSITWKRGSLVAYAVRSDIFLVWTAAGRERGSLGFPVSDDLTTRNGQGRYTHFEGGTLVRADGKVSSYYPDYTFQLDQYQIKTTRSRHEDTNFVYVATVRAGKVVRSQQQPMGDQNDGLYRSGLQERVTINDLSKTTAFAFTITNSGSGNNDALRKNVDSAVEAAASSGLVGTLTGGGVIVGAVTTGAAILWNTACQPSRVRRL